MLFRDFLFSIKNVHISILEKGQIIKLFKVAIVFLYKFIFLDLILYNFFYKKNLDKIYSKNSELYKKELSYLFEYFNSLRQEHGYEDVYQETNFGDLYASTDSNFSSQENFSIADITGHSIFVTCERLKFEISENFQNVLKWKSTLEKRESFKNE